MDASISTVRWRFGNAELDPRTRELRVQGQLAAIEPRSFDVLALLLEHAGELLTFAEMLEAVWTGRIVSEATVTNTIFKIRKILGDDGQTIIKTVPKIGYRLVIPVERMESRDSSPALPELQPGSEVPGRDQWQLVEHLGSGGYGDAWLAQHAKTGERRVFKFCLDSDRLPAFKREVTLYRLLMQAEPDRDDIARILEWNFEQAPFFIESEYAGENLLKWADRRHGLAAVPPDQRLALMASIVSVVASAHSIGVLHKDLKPENILVEERNDRCHVRLCDFGAGRLLEADRLNEFGITRLGFTQTIAADLSTSGTLLYLAPELLTSGMPSVQSDVYALGILLYQMVTGAFGIPMAHGWESAIDDELLRQDIADATHGDRNRRIASAQILADRLTSLPIRRTQLAQDREERLRAEQARKAMEATRIRRPWLIAAACILIIGSAISLYSAASARKQARLAQAFSNFVTKDILRSGQPYGQSIPDISVKNAIVDALPLIPQRFAGDPDSEASLDSALAHTLKRIRDAKDALTLDQRAEQVYQQRYGDSDSRTLTAQIDVVADLIYLGRADEAKTLFEVAFPKLKAAMAPSDVTVLYARRIEARVKCPDGHCAEVLPLYEPLIADIQATHPDDALLWGVQADYIGVLLRTDRSAQAERLVRSWLPSIARQYGEQGYEYLSFHGYLGDALFYQHRFAEAETEFRMRLQGESSLIEPDNKDLLSDVEAIGDVDEAVDRWSEALEMRTRAYKMAVDIFGERKAKLRLGAQLAEVMIGLERYADAFTWAHDTASIAAKDQSLDSVAYVGNRMLEARALIHLNRSQEAAGIVNEILPQATRQCSGSPDATADLLELQAELAVAEHSIPKAHDYAQQAVALLDKTWGSEDPTTRHARAVLQAIPTT